MSAGATWTNVETTIHVNNFPSFAPGTVDWYSPCGVGGGSTYSNNLNYAVYYQGNLVTASGGGPPICRPNPTCTSTPQGGKAMPLATLIDGIPTFTPTISPTTYTRVMQSVMAAPNISENGQPIHFNVFLSKDAKLNLIIFTITGEQVYQAGIEGYQGLNPMVWGLKNNLGQSVGSGLYIYFLKTEDETGVTTKLGKVVILH
jgi:hypothetical protein